MRAAVDEDRCAGHGVCWTLCPEVFSLNDDGFAVVQEPEVPAQFEQAVLDAAAKCPERAITAGEH
jgi:ferredoxin